MFRSDVDAFLPADVGISETNASKILFNFGMDSMDKLAKSAVKSSMESLAMASVVKSPAEVDKVEVEELEVTLVAEACAKSAFFISMEDVVKVAISSVLYCLPDVKKSLVEMDAMVGKLESCSFVFKIYYVVEFFVRYWFKWVAFGCNSVDYAW